MCEFCSNDKDIIFPFQLNKCQRCEGEPPLPAAGLGGIRAPALRPPAPLTWRDWKISKPRRLAKALYQDRREGEGGEGVTERGVQCGVREERGDASGERQGRGGLFQVLFGPGKQAKAFSASKSNEEEQQLLGGTDSAREELMGAGEGGEEGGNGQEYCKERGKGEGRGDGHKQVDLLKVLHADRIEDVVKDDTRGSDSETHSSTESLDEVEPERKGLRRGLASLAMGFFKRAREGEQKTEVKEEGSEKSCLEKEAGCEDKVSVSTEGDGGKAILDEGHKHTAEREMSGAENKEKLTAGKPHRLLAVFPRGRSKGEEERSGESAGKSEVDSEEEELPEGAVVTRTYWRGRKTRKAMRATGGRKVGRGAEKASKTASGEIEEMHDADCGLESGGGQE